MTREGNEHSQQRWPRIEAVLLYAILMGGWALLFCGQVAAEDKKSIKVGQIIIVGNTLIPDNFIRRQIPFRDGATITEAELRAAEKNLNRLDWFLTDPAKGIRPTVSILDPDSDAEAKDILVVIEERPGNNLPFEYRYYLRGLPPFQEEIGGLLNAGLGERGALLDGFWSIPGMLVEEGEFVFALHMATVRSMLDREERKP